MSCQRRRSQIGAALVEWTLIALPLLLMGSVALEVSEWHLTRQRLALALQRATDATALDGGHPESLSRHITKHWPQNLLIDVKLCINDPTSILQDFVDRRLSRELGQRVIRHDHVTEQDRQARRRGWPKGRGPISGRNISEANQLNIAMQVKYRPRSPWVRALMTSIPIQLRAFAVMQSHRRAWTSHCLNLQRSRRGLTTGAGAELPSLGRI